MSRRTSAPGGGPVSRPFTVTGGRTRPRGTRYFDLVDIVVRGARQADASSWLLDRLELDGWRAALWDWLEAADEPSGD